MNSTSYNLRHKEMTTTRITYIYIIYIKIIFNVCRNKQGRIKGEARPRPLLPDPLILPVSKNKGESSAVADPDLQIRRGGGVGLQKFFWPKNKGGPPPPSPPPRAAPLHPQLIRSKANSDVADNETNAHD